MKLVDILLVLISAATTNAILTPTDNNGSLQASGTSSQVSGPTNEPDPGTLDDLQSIVDAVKLSIFDEDWQNIFDPIDSDQDWQNTVDQPSSSTSSQVSGPTNELILEIPDQNWQDIMDELDSSIFDENWRNILDPIDPSTYNEDWQNIVNQPIPNTPSQVSDPIDQVDSNTFEKDQQQPADQPSSSIPDQTQQHLMDATDLNISDKDQQQPIDQPSPSTSKQSRKRRINEIRPSTSSQAPGSTNEPNPSTSGKYWIPLFIIINPNIPSQDPINEPSPSTSKRSRKRRIDQPSTSTSSQDQQQPMKQGKSANTVTNQIAGLSERYQRTFNRINQRLVESEIIQNNKRKECREYDALRFEQWSALSMGEDISGSKYDPKVEKKLKEEYKKISRRVHDVKYELKQFMKRHGLRFEEPN
ncbi:hypothetical protein BATDEDRAFT_93255 [Batrachochytrium dendrobatidis JAM81]|uniref:Uncharacterized protein n=2 Tax=Batrachochytrium dendrobatidis TaxID=109871 RepID=F4PFW1_BATDJ|nr:uncharacterized protein BATDEDRAFT_93255 [Batrachochytrium dendrobatidis JAM81]EGF75882.1 hypothetical protein BATDEDRAFT_93255 [Batrachochytrium dendrobatidis JAM81]|eukprot:XP_006683494.1 hypothetical protein BATDEDRAFT_93255 [Batrachochytrium dendrobatidis JAM81]